MCSSDLFPSHDRAANHIVVYDIPYAVSSLIQSVGRVTRMDTKFSVIHLYMIETLGTIDTYKRKLIQDRLYVIDELFGNNEPTYFQVERLDRDNMKWLKRQLLWSSSKAKEVKRNIEGIRQIGMQ